MLDLLYADEVFYYTGTLIKILTDFRKQLTDVYFNEGPWEKIRRLFKIDDNKKSKPINQELSGIKFSLR